MALSVGAVFGARFANHTGAVVHTFDVYQAGLAAPLVTAFDTP